MKSDYWLLPDGMDEVLPPLSWHMETLRRDLLDLFRSYGYELVSPPLVEHLQALMTGTGNDLDIQTFKLVDQWTGRSLGIRADMTPQVARIDAHQLQRCEPSRYCYVETILKARPKGFSVSRNPRQLGAELFGHHGIQSDVEIIELMLRSLAVAGVESVHLDLGHVGIFRGLARAAQLSAADEQFLFDALQRKAIPEIEARVRGWKLDPLLACAFPKLAMMSGDRHILDEAKKSLSPLKIQTVDNALTTLCNIESHFRQRMPSTELNFDLAELRGYGYKTGVVFAALAPGYGSEIARGGRYDDIGQHFGQARPATGFSADLKVWAKLSSRCCAADQNELIFAPDLQSEVLQSTVDQLRKQGKRVVSQLQGQTGTAQSMGCSHHLIERDGQWVVVATE